MIKLWTNTKGFFVYSADDWENLRKNHRIIGELVGNINSIPVLPLKLHLEEVKLLLEKGIVQICIGKINQNIAENFSEDLLNAQIPHYREQRRNQLKHVIDKVVAAKQKKGDARPETEIFEDELEKSTKVQAENMIWPILMQSEHEEALEIKINLRLSKVSTVRYNVYKDLWEKNYYVTTGEKFGADFLAYLGDPSTFHAIFIVKCLEEPNTKFNPSEIVAFGRLGTAVKKKAVFATFENGTVSYVSLNWIDA